MDPIKDPIKDLITDAIKDSIKDPIKDFIMDHITDSINDPINDPITEMGLADTVEHCLCNYTETTSFLLIFISWMYVHHNNLCNHKKYH